MGILKGAVHLSYRDPNSYLLGVFAQYATFHDEGYHGAGGVVLGAEAQAYLNNLTLYAQAGWSLQVAGCYGPSDDPGYDSLDS